jgi:hypothetical protein
LVSPRMDDVSRASELFGNFTPQARIAGSERHGFLALAEFDRNADGVINNQDEVYTGLRLWQDTNHDGVSSLDELHTLASLGVVSLSLKYHESKHQDEYGNRFKYRAKIDSIEKNKEKWAWDVFLKSQ